MPNKRGTYEHMLAVAKKKPILQHILDNIEITSVESIKSVKLPMWIKGHLIELKERASNGDMCSSMELANALAKEMSDKTRKSHIIVYDVYRYMGEDCKIKGTHTELCNNDFIVDIDDGSLKVNAFVLKLDKEEKNRVLFMCDYVGDYDIGTYNIELLQPFLRDKYKKDLIESDYSLGGIMASGVNKW